MLYQNPTSQKSDLLDVTKTNTNLIALLESLLDKGHIIEVTAIKSDHHDDSYLGPYNHFTGHAIDGWFNSEATLGAYLDITDPRFLQALSDANVAPYHVQTGLTPDAYVHEDVVAAGSGVFLDDGGSHVHLGVK